MLAPLRRFWRFGTSPFCSSAPSLSSGGPSAPLPIRIIFAYRSACTAFFLALRCACSKKCQSILIWAVVHVPSGSSPVGLLMKMRSWPLPSPMHTLSTTPDMRAVIVVLRLP